MREWEAAEGTVYWSWHRRLSLALPARSRLSSPSPKLSAKLPLRLLGLSSQDDVRNHRDETWIRIWIGISNKLRARSFKPENASAGAVSREPPWDLKQTLVAESNNIMVYKDEWWMNVEGRWITEISMNEVSIPNIILTHMNGFHIDRCHSFMWMKFENDMDGFHPSFSGRKWYCMNNE